MDSAKYTNNNRLHFLICLYLYDMSKAQPILVNVVIVSYNVCDFVLEGINSVYSFLKFPFQVILVDNNSTDGTVNQVNSKFPEVKVIANKENKGFSKANNQGFEICNGEFFIMLNPDAALIAPALAIALPSAEANETPSVTLAPICAPLIDKLPAVNEPNGTSPPGAKVIE